MKKVKVNYESHIFIDEHIDKFKEEIMGSLEKNENETIISFEGGEGTVREARANHLRGKKIVVAESDDDNNITFHMDRIFLEQ